jgi:RimJ/RimL family protein N-acetyltransferase
MARLWAPIVSERLSLVVMTPDVLAAMSGQGDGASPFAWPDRWPDERDRGHVTLWRSRAAAGELNIAWGPRAVVDAHGQMLGHVGFHLPPAPLERCLDDPTFVGRRDPVVGGVVELGYTIFPDYRHRGVATEAVAALIGWAQGTGEVGAVLAAIEANNASSLRVLARVGGFIPVGTCRTEAGDGEVVYRRDIVRAG